MVQNRTLHGSLYKAQMSMIFEINLHLTHRSKYYVLIIKWKPFESSFQHKKNEHIWRFIEKVMINKLSLWHWAPYSGVGWCLMTALHAFYTDFHSSSCIFSFHDETYPYVCTWPWLGGYHQPLTLWNQETSCMSWLFATTMFILLKV